MTAFLVRRLLPVGLLLLCALPGCSSNCGSPFTPVGGRSRNYGNVVGYGPGTTPVSFIPPATPGSGGGIVAGPGLPPSNPYPSTPTNPNPTPTPPPNTKPVPNPLPVPQPPAPTPQPTPQPQPSPDPQPNPDPGDAAAWTPWPLPPKTTQTAQLNASRTRRRAIEEEDDGNGILQIGGTAPGKQNRPMSSAVHPNSPAAERRAAKAGVPNRVRVAGLANGLPATPEQDLRHRGGKVIQHLNYVNLYVAGDQAWDHQEVQNIDWALAAAMSDKNLNNVIVQYFNNQPVTARALPSHPLVGHRPVKVSQGDVEYYTQYLYENGYLAKFDLTTTLFNFLLPRGTILNDETSRSDLATAASTAEKPPLADVDDDDVQRSAIVPHEDEGDSTVGLGGYHGSIHVGSATIYYSVAVYSERLADGKVNGIPVFPDPWKNIVATCYHELQEARTDPDVSDAVRAGDDPRAEQYLGWVSDQGLEIGDFPIAEASDLNLIIREVPLADGSGKVPVQFQYSNAVHGPEGPISQPH